MLSRCSKIQRFEDWNGSWKARFAICHIDERFSVFVEGFRLRETVQAPVLFDLFSRCTWSGDFEIRAAGRHRFVDPSLFSVLNEAEGDQATEK